VVHVGRRVRRGRDGVACRGPLRSSGVIGLHERDHAGLSDAAIARDGIESRRAATPRRSARDRFCNSAPADRVMPFAWEP
jgi:hypothetical protein